MNIQRSLTSLATLVALVGVPVASADITVWFDPASSTVDVGETVPVDIMAYFETPVMAWGIDLTIGEPSYAAWTDTAIGPDWDETTTLDGDGLAGLRFDTGISGDVLLATLTFEGLAEGETLLSLSSGPEEDEGFLLEAGGLEPNVQFLSGTLTVIPEPATILLFALIGLGWRRR